MTKPTNPTNPTKPNEDIILHAGDIFVTVNGRVFCCDEHYVNCTAEYWEFSASPMDNGIDLYGIHTKHVKYKCSVEDHPEYFL